MGVEAPTARPVEPCYKASMQRRHAVSALARLALVLAALLSTMHVRSAAAEELMGPVAEATPEQLAFFTESRWSLVFPERE